MHIQLHDMQMKIHSNAFAVDPDIECLSKADPGPARRARAPTLFGKK